MSTFVRKIKKSTSINFKNTGKKIITIIFANLLIAIAFNMFFIPNNLLSGGVGGISLMLHYISDQPTFIFYILLNIPLFIIGFINIDGEFIINSTLSLIFMPLFLNITTHFSEYIAINDLLIETIIGSILSGAGMGLLFKSKASQGGFDIIAVILKRKFNIEIKNILLFSNLVIIGFSGFIFGFRLASYTILGLFIAYEILSKVKNGVNPEKNAMIITSKPEIVTNQISSTINRRSTFVKAQGGYTNNDKTIIYCTLKNSEIVLLKELLYEIDEKAFLTINDLREVKGQGFKTSFV